MFNTIPDKLNNSPLQIFPFVRGSAEGQRYPRNGGPFGLNGGFWYVRLKIKYWSLPQGA